MENALCALNNQYPMNVIDAPIRMVLPFKDQKQVKAVTSQLGCMVWFLKSVLLVNLNQNWTKTEWPDPREAI